MPNPSNKRITADDERLMLEAYRSGSTGSQILEMLGGKFRTTKTVYDALRRLGESMRAGGKRPVGVDHFYFSCVDNEAKAYILGLLVTDGNVRSDGRPEVSLQLVEEDRDVVEFVKREWKSERNILTLQKAAFKSRSGEKVYSPRPMVRIAVESDRMCRDLACYGVVPCKSKDVWLPIVDEEWMPHLIRGVIDGDGTIYRHGQTGLPCVRFVGSPYLVAQVALYLHMRLGVGYRNPSRIKGADFLSLVDYSVVSDVVTIIRFCYGEASVSIRRKMKVAKDIISQEVG